MREFIYNMWPSIVAIVGFLAGTVGVIQFIREIIRWIKEWRLSELGRPDTLKIVPTIKSKKDESREPFPMPPLRIQRLLKWSVVIMVVVLVFFFLSLFLHTSLIETRGELDGMKEVFSKGNPEKLIQLEQLLHRMSILNAERDSLLVADSTRLAVQNTTVQAYFASVDSLNRLLVKEAYLIRETDALANWYERVSEIVVLFRKANDTLRTARDTLAWAIQSAANRVETLESLVSTIRTSPPLATGPTISPQMIAALKAYQMPTWVTGNFRTYNAFAKDIPIGVIQQLLRRRESVDVHIAQLYPGKLQHIVTRARKDMRKLAILPTVRATAVDTVQAHQDDMLWLIEARIKFNASFNESVRNHLASLDSITRGYEKDLRMARDSVALMQGIVARLELERDSMGGHLESLQDSLGNLATVHNGAIDDYESLVSEYNRNNQSQLSLMETLSELMVAP